MKAGYVSLGVSVMMLLTMRPVSVVGQQSQAMVSSCAQSSQTVTRSIEAATGRIEEARQTNDTARLRATVADLQVTFAQMKAQLADCVSLSEVTTATTSTPGMDHSKMNMAPAATPTTPAAERADAAAADPHAGHSMAMPMPKPVGAAPKTELKPGAPRSAARPGPEAHDMSAMPGMNKPAPRSVPEPTTANADGGKPVITLQPPSVPRRSGENQFEVTVKDESGQTIDDADVSLDFFMPAMPSMKMPEMRSSAKLTPAGKGVYRGKGSIGMAGRWDVTVVVMRGGQRLGSKQTIVTVQ